MFCFSGITSKSALPPILPTLSKRAGPTVQWTIEEFTKRRIIAYGSYLSINSQSCKPILFWLWLDSEREEGLDSRCSSKTLQRSELSELCRLRRPRFLIQKRTPYGSPF